MSLPSLPLSTSGEPFTPPRMMSLPPLPAMVSAPPVVSTDTVETTGGADTIAGNGGNDIILGGVNGSPDVLSGNDGNDILLGDAGELIYDDPAAPGLSTLDVVRTGNVNLGGPDV